jgi:hypothetical protein
MKVVIKSEGHGWEMGIAVACFVTAPKYGFLDPEFVGGTCTEDCNLQLVHTPISLSNKFWILVWGKKGS